MVFTYYHAQSFSYEKLHGLTRITGTFAHDTGMINWLLYDENKDKMYRLALPISAPVSIDDENDRLLKR